MLEAISEASESQGRPGQNGAGFEEAKRCYFSVSVFKKQLRSKLFMNYFTRFTTLPVFGQIVDYDYERKEFKTFPCDISESIDETRIVHWLYQYRFLRFIQTPLYKEFQMCQQFADYCTIDAVPVSVEKAYMFMQEKLLLRVSGMKKFRDFLRSYLESIKKIFHDF